MMRASAALFSTASFSARAQWKGLPSPHHPRFQHHALAVARLPVDGLFQHGIQIVERHAGQKSQPSQVHRQDGHVALAHQTRRRQQRAVAAQHDQHVGHRRHLFARLHRRRRRECIPPFPDRRRTLTPRSSSHSSSGGTTVATSFRRGREMMPTDRIMAHLRAVVCFVNVSRLELAHLMRLSLLLQRILP